MANNKVVVKFLADTDQMRKGINQVNGQLSTFGKAVKTAGVALAATFGAREIKDFVAGSISAFASLEEAVSKNTVVFGESAAEIESWARKQSDALALTETAALQYISTLGSILVQSGLTQAEAGELSKQLTTLVADLASFADVPIEQSFNAVKGAIVGEREALKSLGFVITEAEVKTKALNLGLIEQGEELTANAKAQANIAVLMDKTSQAQGDMERTGDSLANQMKKLNAEASELQTYFGKGLVEGFGDTTDKGNELLDTVRRLQPLMESLGKSVGEQLSDWGDLASAIVDLDASVRALTASFGLGEEGIISWGMKLQGLIAPIGTITDGLSLIIDGIVNVNNAFLNSRTSQLTPLFGSANLYSPENVKNIEKTGDAVTYVGSSLGYTRDRMNEWIFEQRRIQEENRETEKSFRGAGGAAKDLGDDVGETARKLEEEFQAALEKTQRQMDEWRQKIVSKMNLGSAFDEANDAQKAAEAARKRLADLQATPVDKRGADYQQREAELIEEARRLGEEAGKNWLDRFAQQATDADTLAKNLANLDAAGINQALIAQIASDQNGLEMSQAIIDGITSEGYGLVKQINRQATIIENAGTALGETLVDPLAAEGAKGGDNFMFGVKGAGKEKNGFLNQVKKDAPRVKKAIRQALKTSVEVKVIYTPDTSRLDSAPGGRSVVRGVQAFERLNGSKWRDRVR
jgi:hypothetical protein